MSASGDFGTAPSGVNLTDNQNGRMLGGVISLMVIATLAVVLRFYTRVKTTKFCLAWDDYLIFLALLTGYGTGICIFVSLRYGNGYHIQTLTDNDFMNLWKLLRIHVILYAACITFTKASIMLFYNRIFELRLSLYIMMSLVLSYFIVVFVTILVACQPASYLWEQYTHPETSQGSCINISGFFMANGVWEVVLDVMILAVPVPIIWNLQMRQSQKLAVIGVLLLGGFVCIAGVTRLIFLKVFSSSDDASWTIAPVFLWSCIEPLVGIVCACLPTFTPLFRRWWENIVQKGSRKNMAQNETSKTFKSQASRKRCKQGDDLDEVELFSVDEEIVELNTRSIMVSEEVTVEWTRDTGI